MKSRYRLWLKEHGIPFFGLAFFVFCYILYIHKSTANIVFQDQFDLMYIIERYKEGELSFHDLWRGHLEHRLFGYNLIFLFNSIFFHLNVYFEFYLGAFSLLVTAVLLYAKFFESLKGHIRQHNWLFYLFYLLILLLVFSLNQWENIVFSLGMYILLKNVFFLAVFISLDHLFFKGNRKGRRFLFFSFWLALSVLVFGAGYSLAMVLSIGLVIFIKALFVQRWNILNDLKIYGGIIGVSVLCLFIYYYKIYDDNMIMDRTSNVDKMLFVLQHIPDAMKYFLLSVSASIFGVDFSQLYLNHHISMLIGVVILIIYIYSLYLYVKMKMFNVTYFPLLLIFYSFLIYGMTLIGRFDYGIDYGMASRYVTETQLGLIGVLWIFAYSILKSEKKLPRLQMRSLLPIFMACFIAFGQVLTNLTEIKIAPHRKAYFKNLQSVALEFENASAEELKNFQYPEPLVREGLEIIKKYELNVFYKTDCQANCDSSSMNAS